MPILYLFWVAVILLLSKLTRQYYRKEISLQEFAAWFLFWVLAGAAGFFAKALDPLAQRIFGVERAIDLGVYIAIAFLFYFFYRTMVRVDRVEKDITKLVREQALNEEAHEKNRNHSSGL